MLLLRARPLPLTPAELVRLGPSPETITWEHRPSRCIKAHEGMLSSCNQKKTVTGV